MVLRKGAPLFSPVYLVKSASHLEQNLSYPQLPHFLSELAVQCPKLLLKIQMTSDKWSILPTRNSLCKPRQLGLVSLRPVNQCHNSFCVRADELITCMALPWTLLSAPAATIRANLCHLQNSVARRVSSLSAIMAADRVARAKAMASVQALFDG